jgi:hypothetical protein
MSHPHSLAAKSIWPDVQDWLLIKHSKDIHTFYHDLMDSYLTEKFGPLTEDARRSMIKELLKNIIQS